MAEENNSSQEKTEDPSQYRIEEFRKKGQVSSSKEINSVIILAVSTLTLIISIIYFFDNLS